MHICSVECWTTLCPSANISIRFSKNITFVFIYTVSEHLWQPEGNGGPSLVPLSGVIEHHIQNDLDPRLMALPDHGLELVDHSLTTAAVCRRCAETGHGGEEVDCGVSPEVYAVFIRPGDELRGIQGPIRLWRCGVSDQESKNLYPIHSPHRQKPLSHWSGRLPFSPDETSRNCSN